MEVEANLTLDLLFSMVNSELEQLLARCCIANAEGKKLLGALDLLTTYYGKPDYVGNLHLNLCAASSGITK